MQDQVTGFRLSPQQRRLWPRQANARFRAQCLVLLEGKLDAEALREALSRVAGLHEILRTTFQLLPVMKFPVQTITERASVEWQRISIAGLSAEEVDARLEELFQQELLNPFDTERGPGMRSLLIGLADQKHALLISLPSLCADERTLTNLIKETGRYYEAVLTDKSLTDAPMQYVQFSEWQNELLREKEAEEGKEFWRRQSGSDPGDLVLPGEQSSAEITERRSVSFKIDNEVVVKLRRAAEMGRASVSELFLACWQTLLYRLTGEQRVVVYTLFDGRKHEELCDLLGLLALYLPISCDFEPASRFDSLLRRIQQGCFDVYGRSEYYDTGLEHETIAAIGNHQIGFAYQIWPDEIKSVNVRFSIVKLHSCIEEFKLKLCCVEREGSMFVEYEYDGKRYSEAQIGRMAGEYLTLLESASKDIEGEVDKLKILTDAERDQIVHGFNSTKVSFAENEYAHTLFERQAAANGDRTAVVVGKLFGEERVSYEELNERSNQLANYLMGRGVGPEVVVGIRLERSIELVEGILGVLKAGGAYMPVDMSYPRERQAYMLEDCEAKLILTQRGEEEWLREKGERVIELDKEREEIERGSRINPGVRVELENLAYVMYTSGSTGEPKGAMITQGGLANYLRWGVREYLSGGGAPVHSPIGFDLTITSLLCPLMGGEVVEMVREEEGIEGLSRAMREGGYSLVKITPSHLGVLSQLLRGEEAGGSTKALVIGGEALAGESVEYWRRNAPWVRIINEYGPTETVVGSSVYEMKRGEEIRGGVPIGRPIANTRINILDEEMEVAPIGKAGEIYIGGEGVGRGYWGRADKTAERFVADGQGERGERVYRTGDIGRYKEGGDIEYLGRNDEQVKIRGYRIEVGEVEAALRRQKGVKEAAVIGYEEEGLEKRLVGYVSVGEGEELSVSEMRRQLGERLPEYMIPSTFVMMKEMPLTANGKIDRQALPAPDHVRPTLDQTYVPPATPIEQVLADVWGEVLGIEQVGIHDSFFALGGDSIRSVRVVALAKERGLHFSVQQLFQYQSIAELGREIERGTDSEEEGVTEQADEEMARLLEQLEVMSEDDVKTRLREKMRTA